MAGSSTDPTQDSPSEDKSVGLDSADSANKCNETNAPPSNQPTFDQVHDVNSAAAQSSSATAPSRPRSKSEEEAHRKRMDGFNMVFGTWGKDNFGNLSPSKIFQYEGRSHLDDLEPLVAKEAREISLKEAHAVSEKEVVRISEFNSFEELGRDIQKRKGPFITGDRKETGLMPRIYYISESGEAIFPDNSGFRKQKAKVEEGKGDVESQSDSSTSQMEHEDKSKVGQPLGESVSDQEKEESKANAGEPNV